MNRKKRRLQQKKSRKGRDNEAFRLPISPLTEQQTFTINHQVLTIDQAFNLAIQTHNKGHLLKAERIYRQILEFRPNHPGATQLLGAVYHQMGDNDTAYDLISKAVRIDPNNAEAQNNLGIVLRELGKLNRAARCYQKAIAIAPNYAEASNNLGLVLQELGRQEDALASYQKAISINPNFPSAYNNLGNTFKELGDMDDAVASYKRALDIEPNFAEALSNMGLALLDLGQLEEALSSCQRASEIAPDNALINYNLGTVYHAQGILNKALASYQSALNIRTDLLDAQSNIGVILHELGRFDEAVVNFQHILSLNSDYADAHANLGNTLLALGKLDEAVASYRCALKINENDAHSHSNILMAENYRDTVTLKSLSELHLEWDTQHGIPRQRAWQDHGNTPDPRRCLRIGLVSPDLGRHPVGYFIVNLLEHKLKDEAAFFCYSDRKPDDMTERLMKLSDEWIDARALSNQGLYERIRSDQIDILFDLAGHTAKNRLIVFAQRPAPIQITWAGYPGSTGLSAMDYIFADLRHVPDGLERYYAEEVIRLPDGWISYAPPSYAPDVGFLPFHRNGFINFGSFNNPKKINEGVLAVWAKILIAIPKSRLILKYQGMDVEINKRRMISIMSAHGVEISRLTFEGRSSHADLLARYNDIDIALDPFPYSGGLTTCEALWMGVPVITVPGETFASRHSLSHLSNVGVPELVAEGPEDYICKVVELANDIARLTDLRSSLRDQMDKSALCDGGKFASVFTAVLRQIWNSWCRGDQTENTTLKPKTKAV